MKSIKINRTWETVHFSIDEVSIELTINRETKSVQICNLNQDDNMKFSRDIDTALIQSKLISTALNWAKQNIVNSNEIKFTDVFNKKDSNKVKEYILKNKKK